MMLCSKWMFIFTIDVNFHYNPGQFRNIEDNYGRHDDNFKLIPQIRKYSRGLYFCETSHIPSFVKIKPSRNGLY